MAYGTQIFSIVAEKICNFVHSGDLEICANSAQLKSDEPRQQYIVHMYMATPWPSAKHERGSIEDLVY